MIPSKEIVSIAALPEPLSLQALTRASFIASGVDENKIPGRIEQITALLRSAPAAADGEALLKWMHETVLKRYVESQTRMDVLLDRGTYNCVSSAVFYLLLAQSRGIAVHGVLTTDHAFCRLPDAEVDVETTTPYGFDPGRRQQAVDAFTGRTGFVYTPPGDYRRRKDIGAKLLISLIYQNRIAALQRAGQWEQTVGLAVDRWKLAGSEEAEQDFRSAITNLAADMDRRGLYEDGLTFLTEAAEILGPEHGLQETASALLGNAIVHSLRASRIEEALGLLGSPKFTALVSKEFIDSRLGDVRNRELEIIVKSGDFDAAIASIDRAFENAWISRARWEELALHLWSQKARRLSSGSQWKLGWEALRDAPARFHSMQRWEELQQTYAHNTVVAYHNRFVQAYRRRQWDSAAAVLNEALLLFPGNPTLLDDKKTLSDHTARQ